MTVYLTQIGYGDVVILEDVKSIHVYDTTVVIVDAYSDSFDFNDVSSLKVE